MATYSTSISRGFTKWAKSNPSYHNDHINLTPYSLMTVTFAVQVISRSMSVALREFGSSDTEEKATYCQNLDSFFDCVNVRSPAEADRKRKPWWM